MKIITLVVGIGLLSGTAFTAVQAQVMANALQNPSLNIDPDIQGDERETIAPLMESLPLADRENVVLFAQDGLVYANKTALKAQATPLIQVQDNLYQDKENHIIALPAFTSRPDDQTIGTDLEVGIDKYKPHVWQNLLYKGSGPYRQVYSKVPPNDNTPGFSYEDAQIYLPTSQRVKIGPDPMRGPKHYKYSNPEIYENPKTQDNSCVYMGGWSAQAVFVDPPTASNPQKHSQKYFAADAGFSHDKVRHGQYLDSWVMVVSAEHYGAPLNRAQERAGAFRIVAGQSPITLKFYVLVDKPTAKTYLILKAIANAIDYQTGTSIGYGTWTLAKEVTQPPIDPVTGASSGTVTDNSNQLFCPWNMNGNGMVLKRMTSIAQQIKDPNSTKNIQKDDPTTCSYIKNAQWINCRLGTSGQDSSNQPWGVINNGGALDYAFTPAIPNVVKHIFGNGLDETDSIIIP